MRPPDRRARARGGGGLVPLGAASAPAVRRSDRLPAPIGPRECLAAARHDLAEAHHETLRRRVLRIDREGRPAVDVGAAVVAALEGDPGEADDGDRVPWVGSPRPAGRAARPGRAGRG